MADTLSPLRTSGDGMESISSRSAADSPLLEPAEQQMLKLITDQRLRGASLSDILGDLELASGVDRPIFRLVPAAQQKVGGGVRWGRVCCLRYSAKLCSCRVSCAPPLLMEPGTSTRAREWGSE